MSTLTMVETKKEATPAMASRRSTMPQRHFELPRQVNQAADGGAFDTAPAEPGFGYDFGRIPVQAPSLAIGDGATQWAAQSCPLAASPRACPFGGACHTGPAQVQAKLAISQPDDIYEQEADRVADQVMRMLQAERHGQWAGLQRAYSNQAVLRMLEAGQSPIIYLKR